MGDFTIVLGKIALSDLFFNAQHDAFDRLLGTKGLSSRTITNEEIEESVKRDAEDWVLCLPISEEQRAELVPWLIRDFLNRV